GDIGNSFNEMIENIATLIKQVKISSNTVFTSAESLNGVTQQTASATDEVASTMEEIARSAGEQASNTENGALQVNDLATRIELVTTSSYDMKNIAVQTEELSKEGRENIKTLYQKSQDNSQAVEKVNEVILEVDKSSNEIGTINET